MSETLLANLINPQVMADMLNTKLTPMIAYSDLATIDNTLVGQPGSKITLPKYGYIGDAVDVPENTQIPIKEMTTSSVDVEIKKAGLGVTLTDEAVLSGFGDPVGQRIMQIARSISQKVDNDCETALETLPAGRTFDGGSARTISSSLIADGLTLFGEDVDGAKILLVHPNQLAQLRQDPDYINASEIQTGTMLRGTVGMIWGCQIRVRNKIKLVGGVYTNYIVKPNITDESEPALAIFMKRSAVLETKREAEYARTAVFGLQHYVAYLKDESNAIKLLSAAS